MERTEEEGQARSTAHGTSEDRKKEERGTRHPAHIRPHQFPLSRIPTPPPPRSITLPRLACSPSSCRKADWPLAPPLLALARLATPSRHPLSLAERQAGAGASRNRPRTSMARKNTTVDRQPSRPRASPSQHPVSPVNKHVGRPVCGQPRAGLRCARRGLILGSFPILSHAVTPPSSGLLSAAWLGPDSHRSHYPLPHRSGAACRRKSRSDCAAFVLTRMCFLLTRMCFLFLTLLGLAPGVSLFFVLFRSFSLSFPCSLFF